MSVVFCSCSFFSSSWDVRFQYRCVLVFEKEKSFEIKKVLGKDEFSLFFRFFHGNQREFPRCVLIIFLYDKLLHVRNKHFADIYYLIEPISNSRDEYRNESNYERI